MNNPEIGATAIQGVGVIVPAHNERARIGACLRALRAALEEVPHEIGRAVCVILDRCQDDTTKVVRRELDERAWPEVEVIDTHDRVTIGELRARGMRRLVRALHPLPVRNMWLLSTDADSTVPRDWVTGHLGHAESGADALAGSVTLDDPAQLHPEALRRYVQMIAAGTTGDNHTHAYAANLGVRASAYTNVGGFPAVSSGEEHRLLDRLRASGHVVSTSTRHQVRTSARTQGRSGAGLAELLSDLHASRVTGAS